MSPDYKIDRYFCLNELIRYSQDTGVGWHATKHSVDKDTRELLQRRWHECQSSEKNVKHRKNARTTSLSFVGNRINQSGAIQSAWPAFCDYCNVARLTIAYLYHARYSSEAPPFYGFPYLHFHHETSWQRQLHLREKLFAALLSFHFCYIVSGRLFLITVDGIRTHILINAKNVAMEYRKKSTCHCFPLICVSVTKQEWYNKITLNFLTQIAHNFPLFYIQ